MTGRPDAPGPLMRRGPRPLLLHLTLAMLRSSVSRAMSPHWKVEWLSLSAPERLALVRRAVQSGKPDLPEAVWFETLAQDAALIAGIAAYRRHSRHTAEEEHVRYLSDLRATLKAAMGWVGAAARAA